MSKPTVLYVEDEENDIIFMRYAFKKASVEHRLESVMDGQQAVAYFTGEPPYNDRQRHPIPGLILLDVNLPLISGFEVLDWLKAQPLFRHIPVIMFSSSGRPEDRRKAKELGANSYMLKPTSGTQFVQTVEELKKTWLLDPAAERHAADGRIDIQSELRSQAGGTTQAM